MRQQVANRCDGAAFQAFSMSVFSRSGDVEPKNRGHVEPTPEKISENSALPLFGPEVGPGREAPSLERCMIVHLRFELSSNAEGIRLRPETFVLS